MLSGVRARKKWEKWAEIIALSKLPASLPKHQTLLPLPWAVCLLHGGTPASYLQGFLMLIRCNYSLLCTSISTLASFDSAVGKILPTGLSSLHEPEISDTYLNFLFAAAGTIPHVFRNRNKLNGIHVFPAPFESGVLSFIHVNLNLTDVLFSGLWTCFGSWVVLFFFFFKVTFCGVAGWHKKKWDVAWFESLIVASVRTPKSRLGEKSCSFLP